MRPQIKREVSIDQIIEDRRLICVYLTPDALEDIKEFTSSIDYFKYSSPNYYHLFIDPRYDFDEVVEYIRNYEK